MNRLASLLVLAIALLASTSASGQRQTFDLATNWKFIKQDVPLTAPTDSWETVAVPHTWNNLDGQDGKKAEPQYKEGYYRGPGWYARALDIAPSWKEKRVFIYFEAASTVAQVYLNGKLIGEHRGGFTAFCFELTHDLRFDGPNELRVRVNNSWNEDVPPLAGDFDVDGGIYRPVHLMVTEQVCVSPLDFGSPGVYLTTHGLTDTAAQVEVKTMVSNGAATNQLAVLETEIADARGHVVATKMTPLGLQASETQAVVDSLPIDHPHLWNGRKDPYLYRVTVRVRSHPAVWDEVTQQLGLRTVAIDDDKGFLLNGQPYPIHGVNCHQDRRDKGWAVSDADHAEDMKIMYEMGVTAIRLAHYPQSQAVHDLADRNGILLWNEIPFVNWEHDSPAFKANLEQQMREMILQRYNHPSAAFWGLFNELDKNLDTSAVPLLRDLKNEQATLDPSRLSVAASRFFKMGFNDVPDYICFNEYCGWYQALPDDFTRAIDYHFNENGSRRIALSEYGAGANPSQHEEVPLAQPKPGGPFHPEEWQSYVHESAWAQIEGNRKLWGSFLWCMFDFASDHRDEGGQPGLNDKGMVTADRRIKKDAYFFYKANWTDFPMVHITSRRFLNRSSDMTEVKIYSNCAKVDLKVNGQDLGEKAPDELHIWRWREVRLKTGPNAIEATAPGTPASDKCAWNFNPP